jgi:ferredoxin-thioredoxin reductase catalytic chain
MSDEPAPLEAMERSLEKRGYYFNPDRSYTEPLLESLRTNQQRYGYPFCPCRLATGDREQDRDAICPCDVRDQDVFEHGTCYCGLYVSREVAMEKKPIATIPERRGTAPEPNKLWRCNTCGYLCLRPTPPDVCPVCGVTRDRFQAVTL